MTQDRPLLLAYLLTALCACELSGRQEAPPGDAGTPLQARGSEACQRWQDAFCDYSADRCGHMDRAGCDDQNRGVVCSSDARAAACTEAFEVATCAVRPIQCNVADIADREVAAEACERYFLAQCESNTRCGIFTSVEECKGYPLFDFDCNTALSVGLNYERCLQELATRRCDQPVPICDGVIHAQTR